MRQIINAENLNDNLSSLQFNQDIRGYYWSFSSISSEYFDTFEECLEDCLYWTEKQLTLEAEDEYDDLRN